MDRNDGRFRAIQHTEMSLSARRAWIEIFITQIKTVTGWSLSARRAWIEITVVATLATLVTVALRKESVDRNVRLLMCF